MTREELKAHCERQIQQFERVEKIMPVTPNDWKRYEEHKLILELLEQESKRGHWIPISSPFDFSDVHKCSMCGLEQEGATRFCPDCGADMRELTESEIENGT